MNRFLAVGLFFIVVCLPSGAFAQSSNSSNENGGFFRVGVKKVLAEPIDTGLIETWKPCFEIGLLDVNRIVVVLGGYFDRRFAVGSFGFEAGPGVKIHRMSLRFGAGVSFSNDVHSADAFYLSLPLNIKNLYINPKIGFMKNYADISFGWQFGDK